MGSACTASGERVAARVVRGRGGGDVPRATGSAALEEGMLDFFFFFLPLDSFELFLLPTLECELDEELEHREEDES
jgi:hypothetical protein